MASETTVLKSVVPMSRDLLAKVNTEIKFSANSILVEVDGEEITLQEAWNRHLREWSNFMTEFAGIRGQVGNDISIPYQLEPQQISADSSEDVVADLVGFNPLYMEITDNYTDGVGTNYAIVSLKPGYTWSDGTTEPKRIPWTTTEYVITVLPEQIDIPEYDGSVKRPAFSNYVESQFIATGSLQGINVTEYEMILTPADNYVWSSDITDTAKASVSIPWRIDPKEVSLPIQLEPEEADGQPKTPHWNMEHLSLYFEISGTTETELAGTHKVKFTPKSVAWWADTHTRETREGYWAVLAAGIPVVTWDKVALTFTGDNIHPEWQNYDPNLVDIIESTGLVSSARDVGRYMTKFRPKPGLTWLGGSTQIVTCNWRIIAQEVTVPKIFQQDIPEYDVNKSFTPDISNWDKRWVTVRGNTATSAGTHTIVFSLSEEEVRKNNLIWEGTKDTLPVFYTWKVSKKKIAKPDIAAMNPDIKCAHDEQGNLKFTGPVIVMPQGKSKDLDYIEVTGNREKDITTTTPYYMVMKPVSENYCWEDETSTPITFQWQIITESVPLPTLSGTYSYTGKEQKISFNMWADFVSVVDNTDIVKDQGPHTTIFRLKKEGTVWLGLTGSKKTSDYSLPWAMGYYYVTIPVAEKDIYEHTGNTISLEYQEGKEPDETWINIKDDTGTDIRGYTAEYDLKDKQNTRWSVTNDTAKKVISWQIQAAQNSITLSATQGKIEGPETSHYDLLVTVKGKGAITPVVSDNRIAVAEVHSSTYRSSNDRTIYTVRFTDGGTTGQSTVKISGEASAGYAKPADKIFTIISQPYRKLENSTLADILRVIRDDKITEVWHVGDQGKVSLSSGKIGRLNIGGIYSFVYLGNNQGDGRAHFLLKSNRTDTLIPGAFFSEDFRHTDGTSLLEYSWNQSYIRQLLSNNLPDLFPSDWKTYLTSAEGLTTKKTQQSFRVTPSSVNSLPMITQDIFFIPSPQEIFGDKIISNPTAISTKNEWGTLLKLYDNTMTDRKYNIQYPYFRNLETDILSWIPNYGNIPGKTNYSVGQTDKGSLMLRGNLGVGLSWYNKNSKMIEDALHAAGGILICFSLA